ncbi:proprotein convertase subtilisin/kexin type 4 isoform X3 [Vulpes vulpes]|uniref:Proprotein convertase subtilisin/kexin type 4 isoform X3 n=1 Tax=Vulpes vulpes TaxID=9627 RepID=A0ABM4XJ55_VULVU
MRPARTALWLRLAVALGLALVGPLPVGWSSARAPIYVSSWAVRVSQGYREAERLARKFGFVYLGQVGGTRWTGGAGPGRPQTPADGRGTPDVQKPQPTPASTSFRFWGLWGATEAPTWAPGGGGASQRCWPVLGHCMSEPGAMLADTSPRSQIFPDGQYFHLRHRGVVQQSLTPHWGHCLRLKKDPKVQWFEQQTLRRRVKRSLVVPTDPWFPKQWYMVWSQGLSGQGVVVSVLDDGIEKDHPDLWANYDPLASYDFNDYDPDPQPRYTPSDENRHGTRCAGEVAAMANNGFCGTGVAYNARIGGVRMLDGTITDVIEAQSLSLQPQHIHIYSASWGPEDDGRTVDGPGILTREAFRRGVTKGRGGLGTLFVWASGNGGLHYDNCNCDGYTNSIHTLSVGSTTEHGRVPWYSEACASTLTTTYSSGVATDPQIVTTDLHHQCTDKHTGTSASAPLAAGMIALALEANPFLTWRDMQHLVVRASRPAQLQAEDWRTNGVGRQVSHHYGYGLLDARLLVDMARTWLPTQPQQKCVVRIVHTPTRPAGGALTPHAAPSPILPLTQVRKNVSACAGRANYIRSLEHVQVQLSLSYSRRGDLEISLTSPMGTRSTLVAIRPLDVSGQGYNNWIFMSTHFWDEDPRGLWTLGLENKGYYFNTGEGCVQAGAPGDPSQRGALQSPDRPSVCVRCILGTRLPAHGRPSVTPAQRGLSPVPSGSGSPAPGGVAGEQGPGGQDQAANSLSPSSPCPPQPLPGTLYRYTLLLYGTAEDMTARPPGPQVTSSACVQRDTEGLCQECHSSAYTLGHLCLSYCPPRYCKHTQQAVTGGPGRPATPALRVCSSCRASCCPCRGGSPLNCTACPPSYSLRERRGSCSGPVPPNSPPQPTAVGHPRCHRGRAQAVVLTLLAVAFGSPLLCRLLYRLPAATWGPPRRWGHPRHPPRSSCCLEPRDI